MTLTLQDALDTDREIYVTIKVPTDPTFWGDECDEDLVRRAAELHAKRLVKWARERWPQPNFFIDSELVWDMMANPTRAKTSGADGWRVREIEEAIENRAYHTWTDDLQAAVDEEAR